jgi:hypothetical protein
MARDVPPRSAHSAALEAKFVTFAEVIELPGEPNARRERKLVVNVFFSHRVLTA